MYPYPPCHNLSQVQWPECINVFSVGWEVKYHQWQSITYQVIRRPQCQLQFLLPWRCYIQNLRMFPNQTTGSQVNMLVSQRGCRTIAPMGHHHRRRPLHCVCTWSCVKYVSLASWPQLPVDRQTALPTIMYKARRHPGCIGQSGHIPL